MSADDSKQRSIRFITHARTPEELRDEFISDLNRRVQHLSAQHDMARNETEKSKIARALVEVKSILEFWLVIEINRPVRKRNRKETQS